MAEPPVSPTDATLLADAAVAPTVATPPTTVLAGRYEILGLLGSGGMGRVYRAQDRELGEVVALKVLHRDLVQSEEMVERFRQEVRLARKVTHRNVARTFDIGEHEGEKFLTMELVAGESLAARLGRGLLSVTEVVALAREVLAGMGAAHAAGVVHRDLKPDNVLLEAGGRVVVTDFGIARTDVPGTATRTHGMLGTPAYMAPEQVGGNITIDARADIYAFGAMLFEMLTGRRAWPGDSAFSVAAARLTEPPPDPLALRPALSTKLASIVSKCLAQKRDQRYGSCAEVERELAALGPSELFDPGTPSKAPAAAAPNVQNHARDRSVAVIPFRNLGAAEDAYFALGLSEDLVDALSSVRGLRVRGRGYADAADQDVVHTGQRLGVDVVVDGSLRRAGDSLRVSARLVAVADGFQIWSSRFEKPSTAAFALNDEVAGAIAAALSAEQRSAARRELLHPQAIELYFRARQAVPYFWEAGRESEANDLFRQALALAPDDPTILSGFVHAQLGRNVLVPMDPKEAVALVRRALMAGPKVPDPWVALAVVRLNQLDQPAAAMRALRRALELGPSHGDAHDRTGRMLLEANAWDEALGHLERAVWLDPSQAWARFDLMRAAALSSDWVKAQAVYDSGDGTEWESRRAFHRLRMWSWHDAPEQDLHVDPAGLRPELQAMIRGYQRAREGRRTGQPLTRADLEPDLLALSSNAPLRARRFLHQVLAEQAAISRSYELTLELVTASVANGLLDLSWLTRLHLLDPLRHDPRFEALRCTVAERAASIMSAWQSSPESLEEALASLPPSLHH